jgi:pimeloyl-ACP methyl ester carboxylesterase
LRLRAILLVLSLALSGCTAIEEAQVPTPTAEISDQSIAWEDCGGAFECAEIFAPLDWLSETGEYVVLKLLRKTGTEDQIPILVNPGGPGSSATKWLREGYETTGTSWFRENFQIIAFDPRGVGESTAVTCSDQALKDDLLYGQPEYEVGSQEDIEASRLQIEAFAISCQQQGPSVAYFNTQQTARDMELLRILLGMDELNFLGFSYGTELGATYAALFPNRVGKFVLDGAVDPTMDSSTSLLGQVKGFDSALRAYLADCLKQTDCPFTGTVDEAMVQISGFLQAREVKTLDTNDERDLGLSATLAGMIVTLYSKESWIYLTQAFQQAFAGDGSLFLILADFYNERNEEGRYSSNINEANMAINCADLAVKPKPADLLDEIREASVVFGKYYSYPDIGCTGWPTGIGMVPLNFEVQTANRPVIIGTTGDPATPYEQAVRLSELLNGRLLTLRGEGHSAYGSNSCISSLVDGYLEGIDLGESSLNCLQR